MAASEEGSAFTLKRREKNIDAMNIKQQIFFGVTCIFSLNTALTISFKVHGYDINIKRSVDPLNTYTIMAGRLRFLCLIVNR